jgi:cellulose synthase/poly-beta-1,6-N-acetylglucosamine synthase-like glycosyltransferase
LIALVGLLSATILLTAWVVYPLAVGIMAAGRAHAPVSDPATRPRVSVVLATREDASSIRLRMEDCLGGDYPAELLEVVVAVDRGVAAGIDFKDLERPGRITVVQGDEPGGKAATLNAGVRASRGAVLVFTDTHQRFQRGAISELIAALGDERVGAASGNLRLPPEHRASSVSEHYWRYERWLRSCEATIHSAVGVTGAVFAVRRTLWQPLPPGLILDDVYTPMRVVLGGKRVAFVEGARAYETRRHTPLEEYHRKVRTMTGVVQLCRWLPAVLVPWLNPVWVQFVCHKLLRLLTPYCVLGLAAWIVALGYSTLGFPFVAGLALVLSFVGVAIWRLRTADEGSNGVWDVIAEGALLQAAVVMGTVNGLMGRWDVWRS